ncbi:MAG: MerR family transcriptional regulator, partial [Parvibaculum sp.]
GYTIKGVQKVFREQGVKFVSETGKGTVDASLAERAREAVKRGERREREEEGGALLDAGARQALDAILNELIALKDEVDETLWESDEGEN